VAVALGAVVGGLEVFAGVRGSEVTVGRIVESAAADWHPLKSQIMRVKIIGMTAFLVI
jgi:hypothetical protein